MRADEICMLVPDSALMDEADISILPKAARTADVPSVVTLDPLVRTLPQERTPDVEILRFPFSSEQAPETVVSPVTLNVEFVTANDDSVEFDDIDALPASTKAIPRSSNPPTTEKNASPSLKTALLAVTEPCVKVREDANGDTEESMVREPPSTLSDDGNDASDEVMTAETPDVKDSVLAISISDNVI